MSENKTSDKQETPRVNAIVPFWQRNEIIDLARQLERELAEAKRLGNLAADNCDEALEHAEEAVRQRDEALSARGDAPSEDALACARVVKRGHPVHVEAQNIMADEILRWSKLNDALAIPGWLQPRVDAVLDRAEEKP